MLPLPAIADRRVRSRRDPWTGISAARTCRSRLSGVAPERPCRLDGTATSGLGAFCTPTKATGAPAVVEPFFVAVASPPPFAVAVAVAVAIAAAAAPRMRRCAVHVLWLVSVVI